jgi:hypothetical protein
MKSQVVGRKFVVSGRDTPTLLDLVKEPFNHPVESSGGFS